MKHLKNKIVAGNKWIDTILKKPEDNTIVEVTNGRDLGTLRFVNNQWFTSDNSQPVYYKPAMWRGVSV